MSVEEICQLDVASVAADDCVLFLWATFPQLQEALRVIKAWDFKYKTVAFVWLKQNKSGKGWFFGLGFWTRGNAELCLLATRGKPRSSAINDGAAALVIMSEDKAKELGITPMATWVAGALGGVDPSIMGVGPVAATRKVMAKTGLTVADMDLIEANEAFAAQSLAVAHDLEFDMDKVNVNGGAIALGHPVGASGARILVTLLYAMKHRGAKKGLATLCIGGGMGCATIVEMD